MKDLINIQDYLVTSLEVGDWEGEEDVVADRLNELLHCAWEWIPDEMDVELINTVLTGIWDKLRGNTALLDVDMDELLDWLDTYLVNAQDNIDN
ncbi:MAG: hypothetical protein ACI9FJ_002761 [Alteromonadaceae bacterium]|jgi:hypothetical protein